MKKINVNKYSMLVLNPFEKREGIKKIKQTKIIGNIKKLIK
jgi:hypothetical protein